ncbi:hypothetical protein D8B29_06450 [Verminephrobacter eiseniae]|nr:hypothetical protein [Verminephrobacter eiseniae]MCW8179271.1 hypothetical protein [Verminephrobacter eiseniae]
MITGGSQLSPCPGVRDGGSFTIGPGGGATGARRGKALVRSDDQAFDAAGGRQGQAPRSLQPVMNMR